MLLFLLFLMPLSLIFYMTYKKSDKTVSASILGFMVSLVIVMFRGFFTFSHKIVYFSFWPNFLDLFLLQTLIPVAILYGIFFFVDHDDIDYKVKAYIPLTMSFYVIYLPYSVITSTDSMYSGFNIFIKPALCSLMIFLTGLYIKNIFTCVARKNKPLIFLNFFLLALAFAFPAAIEVFYLLESGWFISLVMSGFYAALVLASELFFRLK